MPQEKMQIPLSKWNICLLCVGAVLTIAGVALLGSYPAIYDYIISSVFEFGPNTTAYKAWQKPEHPIEMDIYFFNWTNPHEIDNPNSKPKFVEVGPYRYKHMKEKTNIIWNDKNSTITYKYLKYFYFDEENSPRHHSDVITTINMFPWTTAHIINDWHLFVQLFISTPLKKAPVYVQKNVSDLLFNGYEDPILSTLHSIPFLSDTDENRFGWFYGRNGTVGSDGVYNMRTTAGNDFATLQNWNYRNQTAYFAGDCGKIYGSAGEIFPRNVKPTSIHLFTAEMCRSAKFKFVKNETIKGLLGYKFSPGDEVFDNGSKLDENRCYDNSLPSGLLNVSACKEHAPVYLSLPHFYYADPSYINAVEGLNPEKNKHELYITLEPNTGVIIDISARMQINVQVHPLEGFGEFAKFPNILFPVLWFDQKVLATDEVASGLKLLLQLPKIMEIVSLVIIVIGVLWIIGIILFVVCFKMRNRKEKKIQKEEIPLNSKS